MNGSLIGAILFLLISCLGCWVAFTKIIAPSIRIAREREAAEEEKKRIEEEKKRTEERIWAGLEERLRKANFDALARIQDGLIAIANREIGGLSAVQHLYINAVLLSLQLRGMNSETRKQLEDSARAIAKEIAQKKGAQLLSELSEHWKGEQ